MASFVRVQLDYYAALGIGPTAGTDEVKLAFRHLAWRYHPDRNPAPGATIKFQDINEAHQTLSDPARRAAYDARWHPESQPRCSISSAKPHPHSHRTSHKRHRIRAVLLALSAFACFSIAWVAVLTAVVSRHYAASSYSSDLPWSYSSESLQDSKFSMEMYPVSYTDEEGRRSTAWETHIRSYWGGSTRVLNLPDLPSQRAFGTADLSYYRRASRQSAAN